MIIGDAWWRLIFRQNSGSDEFLPLQTYYYFRQVFGVLEAAYFYSETEFYTSTEILGICYMSWTIDTSQIAHNPKLIVSYVMDT